MITEWDSNQQEAVKRITGYGSCIGPEDAVEIVKVVSDALKYHIAPPSPVAGDRAALRERIAKAIFDHDPRFFGLLDQPWPPHEDWRRSYLSLADSVLAVLDDGGSGKSR